MKNEMVCDRKRVPLEPQTDGSLVKHILQYYYKMKHCAGYQCITIVSSASAYVCENTGIFPDEVAAHRNAKSLRTECSYPEVVVFLREKCTVTKEKTARFTIK